MRPAYQLLTATVLVVGVILLWGGTTRYLWSGGYDLTVTVAGAQRPVRVFCWPIPDRWAAERVLAGHLTASKEGGAADGFDGRPLLVTVPTGGALSPVFGEMCERTQPSHLLVLAVMPNGTRTGAVVDLPDRRETRAVTVTLP